MKTIVRMIGAELDAWKANYPRVARWLQTFDQALAVARPAITVTLCVSGGVLAGDLWARRPCTPPATWPGRSPPTRPSPRALPRPWSATTGEGARQAAARLFRRLQTRFAQKRAQWLADFVETQLLGDLLAELRQGAAVPESIEFKKVEAAMAEVGWDQLA